MPKQLLIKGWTVDFGQERKILELIKIGVTQQRKLIKELRKNDLPILSKIQINNLKQNTNIKANGTQTCNPDQWLAWIKYRTELLDDEDTIFVAD